MTGTLVVLLCYSLSVAYARMNVLFLVGDDLRPDLGAYDGNAAPSPVHPPMITPNIDALARKSLLLKRAYVQYAVCGPSRASLLTGRRPDTTHVYDLHAYWRDVGGNFTTIPQYFKEHGYRTIGIGKIFHPKDSSNYNDPISWTDPYFESKVRANSFAYSITSKLSWKSVPMDLMVNNSLQDTQNSDHAIKMIREAAPKAKTGEQPFFIAHGFHKPHLPFVAPQKYFDMYPLSSIRLPPNPYAPDKMPDIAWSKYPELRGYNDIKALGLSGAINTTLPDDVTLALRRAYYSVVSYMDFELGRVVQELENQGLANNTVVVFFGDHGWQLGEHGEWTKHTDFDLATHTPMMIHVPGATDEGIITEKLVEFVDLFPTLVDVAGLPAMQTCPEDSSQILVCSEGSSLVPLINNPEDPNWKQAVFSQIRRHKRRARQMGYSVTTDRYRYTEYAAFMGEPDYKPDWNDIFGLELYDHQTDPQENTNLAYNDEEYGAIRLNLQNILHSGWRGQQSNPSTT